MAHNMLHDNLSCGPRSSHSRLFRRTSSDSAASRPVNSAIHHPSPVVVQPNRDQGLESFPMPMPVQTSPYNPHRYHSFQPHCPNVQITPDRYVTSTFQGYQPHGYSPQMHIETHNTPVYYVPRPNEAQTPSNSGHVISLDTGDHAPVSSFRVNYPPHTHSSTLNVPSPGHLAVSQCSPHVVSSPSSPTTLSPWPTPGWSPQYQYVGPVPARGTGPDSYPIRQNDQYPPGLRHEPSNESSPRHLTVNHEAPRCSPGPRFSIVIEDPKSPHVHREKRVRTKEDTERQREDIRRLKERGGACVWCYLNKKKCDIKNPCSPCSVNKRACFRDATQLWLYVPLLDPSTRKSSEIIKEETFKSANEAFLRLLDMSLPQPGATQAVVKIRWHDPNPVDLLIADISQLSLADTEVSDGLKENLIQKSLANIQSPTLQNLDSDAVNAPLIQSGIKMLGLLAALVTLSRSRVYVRPADLGPARMTMFFILATHAKALCETSERFCTELCETMRRKSSHENATARLQERDGQRLHNPVWVAAAIYHRVITGILEFGPNPLISEIFVGMKSRLRELRSKVNHIQDSVPQYQDHDKLSSKPTSIEPSACVPDVPVLDYFEITFWLESEGKLPVPTALDRQNEPYSVLSDYWVNSLLDENFDLDPFHQSVSGEVPGPRAVHFRPTLEATNLMLPKQETMSSDLTSLYEQPAKQKPTTGGRTDFSGPSLPSYAGDTVLDSVFSDFTWIEQFCDNNGHIYHHSESAFDPNAFFGNEDSISARREGIFPELPSESPPAGAASNKVRLSPDMTDPRLNVTFTS
ncbi:hypothetical protein DTO280E4_7111 [Paecilomyces variotii]|nr:hypothetical protein DTO027B9_5752 [Paecilomyces variotii]KAJ9353956.1 hypothetical protein DTO280E4_7111 [Paecilomyces variotii]